MFVKLQISNSSEKILSLFIKNENKPLFVNEIIRETRLFPNAIQRSLKTLASQNIIKHKIKGNKKFYSLNKRHVNYAEIINLIAPSTQTTKKRPISWIKLVNREVSVALNATLGSAQASPKYMHRFRLKPTEYVWYNSVTGGVYYANEEIVRTGKTLSKEIKKDSMFAKQLAESCVKDGETLIKETKKIVRKDLLKLSNTKLRSHLTNLLELYMRFCPYLIIPHSIESAIETELELKVPDSETKEKLLEPTQFVSDEQLDELKLTHLVKRDGWSKQNKRMLAKLTKEYCWLPMMALHNKPFDTEHFKNIIDALSTKIKNPKKEIEKLKKQEVKRKRELKNTLKKINADQNLTDLVNISQAYIKLRTYRMNIIRKFHFYHLPLLNEIASRIGIEQRDVPLVTYQELLESLKNTKLSSKLVKQIKKRRSGFAILTWKAKTRVISGIENIIHAIEQYNIFQETPEVKREIKGNPACRGIVTGRVKLVKKLSELDKVTKGDILVAKMTTPDYMTAINKAAAIVTDEGGITCHAAIVSREFNIPCVVGTKNASAVLSDNDLVEVNADEGIVRVIETMDLPDDVKEIHGKTIFKGKVKGPARIILDASDFDSLKNGDVLIAPGTPPEYLSLLYRAKGFVVDEESISSHAVLYGKALELPSIMGTSFARNVIEDGEMVELDATKGTVKRLST